MSKRVHEQQPPRHRDELAFGIVICFAISRMLCSVAVSGVMLPTVPELSGRKRKTGMERSGPTSSAFHRAGWRLAPQEWHRRNTCCAANDLYASRRQLRASGWPGGGGGGALSWTGSWLSMPPAADFGPGPEAAESLRCRCDRRACQQPARVALCLANGEAGQKTNVKPKLPAGPQEPRDRASARIPLRR